MKDHDVLASISTQDNVIRRVEPLATSHIVDNRQLLTVFVCLTLTVLLTSTNVTMVSPAMPRIVVELGGMEFYTWVVVSALLSATVLVPIVGKLSDLYGRKPFYLGGIVVFLLGSILAGLAPDFWTLVAARGVQGLGIGVMPPLSQAIIGDLVSPRERGKYQGIIDATFAVSAVLGPLVGGLLTDNLGWRWLFFVNVPLGLIAFGFIARFLRLPSVRRAHSIDYRGITTLCVALTALLLGISLGGNQHSWDSPLIIGLMLAGACALCIFVIVENKADEPVLPLRLWQNSIFTFSNVASAMVGMAFLAGIYFLPMYVQGVLGASATNSGAVMVPMILSLTCVSIISGQIVARTGRYKPVTVIGMAVATLGFYLLTRMDASTPYHVVVINMVVVGVGVGTGMQTFVLIVQNAVDRKDLGVATATAQLFRSIGRTAGTAILGTILTQRMIEEIGQRLPDSSGLSARSIVSTASNVIDPTMQGLPQSVTVAVREGLAAALQSVFWAALPALALALAATLLIREIPLSSAVGAESTPGSDDSSPSYPRESQSWFDVG